MDNAEEVQYSLERLDYWRKALEFWTARNRPADAALAARMIAQHAARLVDAAYALDRELKG